MSTLMHMCNSFMIINRISMEQRISSQCMRNEHEPKLFCGYKRNPMQAASTTLLPTHLFYVCDKNKQKRKLLMWTIKIYENWIPLHTPFFGVGGDAFIGDAKLFR